MQQQLASGRLIIKYDLYVNIR